MASIFSEDVMRADRADDKTQPAAFGPNPPVTDRNAQATRIAAVLATYCTPRLQYDGMSAYEVANKVLAVIDLWPEQSDSQVRR